MAEIVIKFLLNEALILTAGFILLVILLRITKPLQKKHEEYEQKKREDAAYAALKRLEAEKEKELAEKSRE